MGTKPEWHLNLPKKAEALVFKLIDERLEKTGEATFEYDVWTVSSMTFNDSWRGFFTTSLADGIHYDVTYNDEAKAFHVEVLKTLDTLFYPY